MGRERLEQTWNFFFFFLTKNRQKQTEPKQSERFWFSTSFYNTERYNYNDNIFTTKRQRMLFYKKKTGTGNQTSIKKQKTKQNRKPNHLNTFTFKLQTTAATAVTLSYMFQRTSKQTLTPVLLATHIVEENPGINKRGQTFNIYLFINWYKKTTNRWPLMRRERRWTWFSSLLQYDWAWFHSVSLESAGRKENAKKRNKYWPLKTQF